jgi:hypothetical protein
MRYLILLFLVALLVPPAAPGYAQTDIRPLVVFVVDGSLRTASPEDIRAGGISRLDEMFQTLGARTDLIRLDQAIPTDAQVVVLVQPQRRLSAAAIARLWVHLQRGGHLLLAIDPAGQGGQSPERANAGLALLLARDYGIGLEDTFVTESWFTPDVIQEAQTSYIQVYADSLPHPILDPLHQYELPVQMWGARSLWVEPIGIDSYAIPLLATSTAYGEAGKVFDQNEPEPLEVNLDVDRVGLLNVGALAENTATGSRVVVLGDAEIVENDYGLADGPRYLGDYLLVQRAAAWLLNIPEANWPALPPEITWLTIDGDSSDWPADPPMISDPMVGNIQAFRNDSYLYLRIDPTEIPDQVRLRLDRDQDSTSDVSILVEPGSIRTNTNEIISDARFAAGASLELQLPLRMLGANRTTIKEICLLGSETLCVSHELMITAVNERAPTDLRMPDQPLAAVRATQGDVNLRSGPGTYFPILAAYPDQQLFAPIGRSERGDWIQLRNASYTGWMSSALVTSNCDLALLPVIVPE